MTCQTEWKSKNKKNNNNNENKNYNNNKIATHEINDENSHSVYKLTGSFS